MVIIVNFGHFRVLHPLLAYAAGDDPRPEREDPVRAAQPDDRARVRVPGGVGRLPHAVPRAGALPGRLPRAADPQRTPGEDMRVSHAPLLGGLKVLLKQPTLNV